jgi:hypothetical protein
MWRWSAPLVLLDAYMESKLADLVINRLIRGAGDSKLKPVELLELVAGHRTSMELCQWTTGDEKARENSCLLLHWPSGP